MALLEKQRIIFEPEEPIHVPEGADAFCNDHLNHKEFVERLIAIVRGVRPPFTLGMYGEWGCGKTSAMKLLQESLKKDGYVTCWFEAWRYEKQEDLLFPLFHRIQEDCKPSATRIQFLKKIATVVTLNIADHLLDVSRLPSLLSVKKTFDEYEKNYRNRMQCWVDEVSRFRQEFTLLVKELTAGRNAPAFVIFVDDLDRCLPDTSISLLESLKNFLSVAGCVFVLGVDEKVIAKAVTAKYGQGLIDGESYLEKMVTLPFRVPVPGESTVERFITSLLERAVEQVPTLLRQAFISCGQVLAQIRITNPRRLRRIAYRFILYLTLDQAETSKIEDVIRLLCMAEFYPTLYKMCRDHPLGRGYVQRLRQTFRLPLRPSDMSEFSENLRNAAGCSPEIFLSDPRLESILQLSNQFSQSPAAYFAVVDFLSALQK